MFNWEDLVKDCISRENPLTHQAIPPTVTLNCLPAVFLNIVYALLLFSGIGAMIFIMFGGLKFITSTGDPKQIDEGKKAIIFAIIGLVVVLLAFAMLSIIAGFTGLNCIKFFGFENCK